MTTEQELNEKLAKWAGFNFFEVQRCECHPDLKIRYWHTPNGDYLDKPDFTQSLDYCFKWLVPKVQGKGYYIQLKDYHGWYFQLFNSELTPPRIDQWANTPALALCRAIEQLIDAEAVK